VTRVFRSGIERWRGKKGAEPDKDLTVGNGGHSVGGGGREIRSGRALRGPRIWISNIDRGDKGGLRGK